MTQKMNVKRKVAAKSELKKRSGSRETSTETSSARVRALRADRVLARDVLGVDFRIDVNAVRAGFRVQTIDELRETLDLPMNETLRLIRLSKQTYQRRAKEGRLKPEESDRVWRMADLIAKATDLLGDEESAVTWLRTRSPALDGESPLERATTEIGARDVERLIGRLEHGIPV